jgi:hypothetical protein
MPVEGRKFGLVDQNWRHLMEQTSKESGVMDCVNPDGQTL